MDWWDNRDKELLKLMRLLDEKKEQAYQIYQQHADDPVKTAEKTVEIIGEAVKPMEMTEEAVESVLVIGAEEGKAEVMPAAATGKVASVRSEKMEPVTQMDSGMMEYCVEEYTFAEIEITDLSTVAYIKRENLALIADRMQQIVDAEAPIMYDRLVKKTLRAFNVARSSPQTLEATDRAFKKVSAYMNKQAGAKFYWRKNQHPDQYRIYRSDVNSSDRRPGRSCRMKKNVFYWEIDN